MGWVLISAPIYQRDWILSDWFAAIEAQDFPMEDLGFQFEAGPNDDSTINELMSFHSKHPEVKCFDVVINERESHFHHVEGQRNWKKERYAVMANFRNNLLERATAKAPDAMFSLDTDILLPDPITISKLFNRIHFLDAVSPLCYMTPMDIEFPNVMTWGANAHGYRQPTYPIGTLFQADVIMAAVMMSRQVYTNARYQYHPQGEDLGFALDCSARGFKLFSASDIYAPHIMSRAMLMYYKQSGDMREQMMREKFPEKVS